MARPSLQEDEQGEVGAAVRDHLPGEDIDGRSIRLGVVQRHGEPMVDYFEHVLNLLDCQDLDSVQNSWFNLPL